MLLEVKRTKATRKRAKKVFRFESFPSFLVRFAVESDKEGALMPQLAYRPSGLTLKLFR